jgi:hypothetical protein
MPNVLEHIDAIARQQQRDVFYIRFPEPPKPAGVLLIEDLDEEPVEWDGFDGEIPEEDIEAENSDANALETFAFPEVRHQVLTWLTANGIAYEYCFGPASDSGFGRWAGEVFVVDALHEEGNPVLQAVNDYLHAPNNEEHFPGVALHLMRLTTAMENAYMDEPEYEWD